MQQPFNSLCPRLYDWLYVSRSLHIAWIILAILLTVSLLVCYKRESEVSGSARAIALAASTAMAISMPWWHYVGWALNAVTSILMLVVAFCA